MMSSAVYNPDSVWQVPDGFRSIYSHAVEVPESARTLFISGQAGVAPDGALRSGFAAQLEQAMDNVEALLRAAEMTTVNVVKANYYLTRAADLPTLGEVRRRRWAKKTPEAVTVVVVSALARPEFLVEVEAVAAMRRGA
jgi:enamine deaminase RidA (YjgF/YER057c/UK114 family)